MVLTHQISLWHELDNGTEVELKATVTAYAQELEVVWDDASDDVLRTLSREERQDYQERAELKWADVMADQDTDLDRARDNHMERCKERAVEGW